MQNVATQARLAILLAVAFSLQTFGQISPDTEPPVPLWAIWKDDHSILVRFNEALSTGPESGTVDPFAYEIRRGNQLAFIPATVLVENTAVILTNLASRNGAVIGPYFSDGLRIYPDYISDLAGNLIESELFLGVQSPFTVLPLNSEWSYNQAGVDLGPNWFATPVNTSGPGWQSGPGVLGEEDGGEVAPLLQTDLQAANEGGPNTIYFVKRFTLPIPANEIIAAGLSYYLDDGAVVYLNGVEVHRSRIAPGQQFNTLAETVGDTILEGPFPIAGFVEGVNELAVEVHQGSPFSSDIVWGAQLSIYTTVIELPPVILGPEDTTIFEGNYAFFMIELEGFWPGPITYQWQHNGVDLTGETNPSLVLPEALRSKAGTYRVLLTNNGIVRSSAEATLTVIPDDTSLKLVSAVGSIDPTQITLTFDDRVDQASANTISHYTVRKREGSETLAINAVTWLGDAVVLTTQPRLRGVDYEVVVADLKDKAGNPLDPNPTTANVLTPYLTIHRLSSGDVELRWNAGPEWILTESSTLHGTFSATPGNPTSPAVITPTTSGTKFYQLKKGT